MEFGRIARDSSPIALPEWNKVIASMATLEQMPDRDAVNPFTQEKLIVPGEGKAFYVARGKRIGNAGLENGEVLTTGIPHAACEQIAQFLNAKVYEDDRS